MPRAAPTHRTHTIKGDGRQSASKRGYTKRWRKVRRMVLRRQPLCVWCGDVATQVDHIVAMACGGAQYDMGNLQAMCASCHSKKTANEDGGFGHAKAAK